RGGRHPSRAGRSLPGSVSIELWLSAAQSVSRHSALPHRSARRSSRCLPELRSSGHLVQLVQKPALPQVPDASAPALAGGPRTRTPNHQLLPCRVHRAPRSRLYQRQFSHRLLRILADDCDRLGRRDVVPRAPVWFVGNAVEIFLDNLLSPRQSIASAHGEIMADRSSELFDESIRAWVKVPEVARAGNLEPKRFSAWPCISGRVRRKLRSASRCAPDASGCVLIVMAITCFWGASRNRAISSPEPVLPPLSPAQEGPVAEAQGVRGVDMPAQPSGAEAVTWDAIEISFLSDERVQIRNGANRETLNYAEFGFQDARNGKPNRAWEALRVLAAQRGIIGDAATVGKWPEFEKRVQEIRKVLRKHFGISADPIPFVEVEGTGYQVLFKISCSPSFHT